MTSIKTPSDAEIEALAIEYEAFGFGSSDAKGLTTHGFDPDGLSKFVQAVLDRWGAQPAMEPVGIITGKLGDICCFRSSTVRKGDAVYAAAVRP